MSRPKVRALPRAEKERRWRQHQESLQRSLVRERRLTQRPSIGRSSLRNSIHHSSPRSEGHQRLSPGAQSVVAMLTQMDAPPVRVAPMMGAAVPTGLFSVTQVFEPTTSTNSDNIDRFAALFQPTIGVPASLPTDLTGDAMENIECYPNLIVKQSSSWPSTNWGHPSNYESGTNTGSDLDTVDGASVLFQSAPARANVTGATSMTAAMPFGTAPASSTVYPASFDPDMSDDGTNSELKLPVGTWVLALRVGGTGLSDIDLSPQGDASVTNNMAVVANSGATVVTQTFRYTQANNSDSLLISVTGTTVTDATVWISDYPTAVVSNTGAVSTVRPVAMQVLATCVAPVLDRGGTIATALLPANDVQARALSAAPVPAPGSPYKWEELSRFNLPGSVYSGKFEKGTYTWWNPEDVQNIEFLPPEQMCQQDYPSIIVAGQYTPTGTPTGGTKPVRIIVRRVFEYTSDSQALNLAPACVEYQEYLEALNYLKSEPRTMENDSHNKWFKKISRGITDSNAIAKALLDEFGPTALKYKQFIGSFMF